MGLHIVATGRSLPQKALDNHMMSELVDTNDEWITTRTGIKTRYICENETCVSLAVEAARKAISKIDGKIDEIGAVVVATSTPDYVFPSVACLVAKELGLKEEILTFDMSAACTGFLHGLDVCRGLLTTHKEKYVLLIGAERMSKIVDYTDRSTCILFGDGAGAAILEAHDKEYIQHAWSRGDVEALNCNGVGNDEMHIHMKGNDVFKFAVTVLKKGIDVLLDDSGLSLDDVDYVVCHQANERIIDHVRKKYPGNENKFYMNISKYGNTSAASIPIALDELFEAGKLKTGMRIICVGFGAGLNWGSVMMEI